VKVLDFGLARKVLSGPVSDATTHANNNTDPKALLGTTGYMSPEQASGGTVAAASDMFALGIVVYEMLTGRRPFTGDSIMATLRAIINEHPVPPSRFNPEVPGWLEAIVTALLAKEPGSRPSADKAAWDLDRAAGAAPVSAFPVPRRHSVGRDAERRTLLQALEQVASGHGTMIGVLGEPGIGKSTLVDDALAEMAGHVLRPCVARGKCSERLAGAEAYLPLLEVLDNLLHPGTGGGGFSDMMRTIAPTWYVHIAPPSTTVSGNADAMREDVKTASQERMKRELSALFQEISRVRPLVLFIDDLHWADASTIDLLNYLAGRFEQTRMLLIVACRPADLMLARHPFLHVRAELRARGMYKEIELDFLTRPDVQQYVAMEFPRHQLPDALATLVHDKTEGSPLFMVDLLRYLRDRGAIVRSADTWTLARPIADVERDVPDTVRNTISRNLDRLDEVDRRLAATASVQGHEFDAVVVSDVLGLDPAEVEERLETLQRVHRLVRLLETRECPDKTLTVRYRFVHVLYQNLLYGSLQPTRRVSLSGKVAASLVAHYGPGPKIIAASELAFLYEAAREFAPAARYFLAAAQHATKLLAFGEGALLARRGLAALEAVPVGAERMQSEIALQVALAACLRATEGWAAPSVEQIYLRVRDILEQAGDAEHLFPVLWGLTLIQGVRCDLHTLRLAGLDIMQRAETAANPLFVVAAQQMLGSSLLFLGETVEANALLTRQAELYNPEQHGAYVQIFGLDPGMIGRGLWARTFAFLGRVDEARRRGEETIAIARRQRHPVNLVFALCLCMHTHLLRREPDDLLAQADETKGLCTSLGLVSELEWTRGFEAWAIAERGDLETGIAQLRDSLDRQAALHSTLVRSAYLALLAELLLRARRFAETHAVIAEGVTFCNRTNERFYEAELLRVEGSLFAAEGRTSEAEASLRKAIDIATRQSALTFELRATIALAHLLHDQHRSGEGLNALVGVYGRFTEGFDTADLRDADALIQALAVTGESHPA
jgi:adenylate cyclase